MFVNFIYIPYLSYKSELWNTSPDTLYTTEKEAYQKVNLFFTVPY